MKKRKRKKKMELNAIASLRPNECLSPQPQSERPYKSLAALDTALEEDELLPIPCLPLGTVSLVGHELPRVSDGIT